jgi:hypothetical protein
MVKSDLHPEKNTHARPEATASQASESIAKRTEKQKLPKPEKSSAVQTWSCHEGMLLYMFAVFMVEKRSRTQKAGQNSNAPKHKERQMREKQNRPSQTRRCAKVMKTMMENVYAQAVPKILDHINDEKTVEM